MFQHAVLTALLCAWGAAATEPVAVGISGDEAPGKLKLNYTYRQHQWLEEREGKYPWSNQKDTFQKELSDLKKAGVKVAITFTNVHMDQKHLPEYVKHRRFNDPILLKRWSLFLSEFLKRYGEHVDFIYIGNEVNNYFGTHKDEWNDYLEFVKTGSRLIHALQPKIKVSVTLAAGDARDYWKDLTPHCDLLAFTYYAPCSAFTPTPTSLALDSRNPAYFAKVLDEALRLAGSKPALITEIGCATHKDVGSSPELQAELVKKFFGWLRGKESKLLGVCWLSIKDWNYEGTRLALKGNLGDELLKHEGFLKFVTSLGLQYEDGREKPGYVAFREALAKYRAGQ